MNNEWKQVCRKATVDKCSKTMVRKENLIASQHFQQRSHERHVTLEEFKSTIRMPDCIESCRRQNQVVIYTKCYYKAGGDHYHIRVPLTHAVQPPLVLTVVVREQPSFQSYCHQTRRSVTLQDALLHARTRCIKSHSKKRKSL